MPEPPAPPRDPGIITAELIGDVRRNLRAKLMERYGRIDAEYALELDRALGKLVRVGEHHAYNAITRPGDPPDPDRRRTPVEPRTDPWEAPNEHATPVVGRRPRRR